MESPVKQGRSIRERHDGKYNLTWTHELGGCDYEQKKAAPRSCLFFLSRCGCRSMAGQTTLPFFLQFRLFGLYLVMADPASGMGRIFKGIKLDGTLCLITLAGHSGARIVTRFTFLDHHPFHIGALLPVLFRMVAFGAFIGGLMNSMGELGRFRDGGRILGSQESHLWRTLVDVRGPA